LKFKLYSLNKCSFLFVLKGFYGQLIILNNRYLEVVKIYNLFGVFDNRRGVRGKEKFLISYAYHQRAAFTGRNQLAGTVFVNDNNGIGSHHFMKCKSYSLFSST